jgi:hypothetical protein
MSRPVTHPVKKWIGFSDAMLAEVERWRVKQKPALNTSQAIRRLLELGLKVKESEGVEAATRRVASKASAKSLVHKSTRMELAPANRVASAPNPLGRK